MPKAMSILDDPAAIPILSRYFAVLIAAHVELSRRETRREQSPLAVRFGRLLGDFTTASTVEARHEAVKIKDRVVEFSSLLTAFSEAREQYRRGQENHAEDFNILSVLQLTGKEIRHSMVLAWLLDHDIGRSGTHAQGRLGFRLFLQEFRLPIKYADANYRVRREVVGDASIVDVEIAARGQFLIHIENKIWANEGVDQTDREWSDLQRRARSMDIEMSKPNPAIHALYLTPHGSKPTNPHVVAVSWRQVIRVLEQFAAAAKPHDVKLFAAHYAKGIRQFIVSRNQDQEEDDGEESA